MLKIVVEHGPGGYKLEAREQAAPGIWLIKEYSGGRDTPFNTYATSAAILLSTIEREMKVNS